MPSSQTFRMPVWLPLVILAIAVIAILLCVKHLKTRAKARWPW